MKDIFEVNYDNNDIIDFVQNNAEFYITKFNKIKESKRPITWNWPAFFFSTAWFLYRKMYTLAFCAFLLTNLISYIFDSTLFSWILSILCGMFGNYLYLNHCNKKLSDIVNLDYPEKQVQKLKQGGVSIAAVILGFLLLFCFSFIYSVWRVML